MTAPDPVLLDVDARFLLANERTLLAWVRTALALIAGGVAIEQFAEQVPARTLFAVVLFTLGVLAAVAGAVRYRRADQSLRRGRVPATGLAAYLMASAVAVIGVGLALAVLV